MFLVLNPFCTRLDRPSWNMKMPADSWVQGRHAQIREVYQGLTWGACGSTDPYFSPRLGLNIGLDTIVTEVAASCTSHRQKVRWIEHGRGEKSAQTHSLGKGKLRRVIKHFHSTNKCHTRNRIASKQVLRVIIDLFDTNNPLIIARWKLARQIPILQSPVYICLTLGM